MAGAVRSADMIGLVNGLARADECLAFQGDPPVAAGVEQLGHALVRLERAHMTAVLLVGYGERDVLLLDEDLTSWGLFGRADPVGQA